MISVSDAWKEKQKELLLPESFIEISCAITEVGVQEEAVATGTTEAIFSDLSAVTGVSTEQTTRKYATLETNLWVLDGTRNILPDAEPYPNIGYVCDVVHNGNLLPYPYKDIGSGDVIEKNGATFEDNGDGTITVDGTATAGITLGLGTISLEIGKTYTLSGCVGGSNSTYRLRIQDTSYSQTATDIGRSAQFTAEYTDYNVFLYIFEGTVLENVKFSPQVVLGTEPKPFAPYISDSASVTLSLPKVHTVGIAGVTITWSSEYGEYATQFSVVAKNGDTVVAETTVADNTSNHSLVYLDIVNYDSITVTVIEWSIPTHRPRIDLVRLGLDLTFTKNNILSYSHEQSGCILSGELPKNSIEFSVDNSDNRWNPNNPSGLEKYLSERQRLTVRYGLDIDGTTEWIKAGTFYLSEWKAPANGMEASFVARDILEYMINVPYTGIKTGTAKTIAQAAIEQANLPLGTETVIVFNMPTDYEVSFTEDYSIAEVLQYCANATGSALYQDRNGVLRMVYKGVILSDYTIPVNFAYSWPEIELSKSLKEVSVSYGEEGKYVLSVSDSGETQTVDNPLVQSEEHAAYLADLVSYQLKPRKIISGEYRADPRLDLFDYVAVETKFGTISPVVISNIKYTYSGAFRGSYTGRVWEG